MASRSDPDPLKTVLFQELDRYNALLNTVRRYVLFDTAAHLVVW